MKRKSWLVTLMLGSCLLANSQLANAEENQSFGIEEDPTPVVDQPIPAAMKRTAFPQTFDPRNGDDAPVKDQNPRNVCWTFAATGALESALFKQTGDVVDFSERYFDYLSAHNATGVANSNPYSTGRALGTGGQEYFPLFSVTRWQGPVLEEEMPFIKDVSIPFVTLDQLEVDSDFHMQGMVALPKLGRGYSKEALAGKVTRMKEQIMTTTALTYQWSSACHKDSKYYNNAKAAYFVPQEATNKNIDHSSLIVGWDDHYSKENFGENKPENDGAFIVRNSWATTWGDQGYYYVSYEDYYIATSQMYGASQIESVDNYDTQYTHTDFYSYHTSTLTTQSTDHYTMANVYELEGEEEELMAVGFQTMHYDVPYEIFVNPKGEKITNLNELVKVGEGVKKNPGIETFKLDQGIILSDTDKFAVVIRMVRPEGVGKFEILLESSYASPNKVSDYGQSYISSDPSRTSIRYTDTQSLAFANIYVDAYTDKRVAVESVKITPEKLELVAGDEKQLQAEFTPEEATNKKVSWTSSNPEIASVDGNGKVTGIKEGSATITMMTEDGNKTASSTITVTRYDDHGNTQNNPTTLELGKETRFTTNYAWDIDYFHFEKAGYYALTVQLDEALPDNKAVRFSFNNPGDNSWNGYTHKSLDMSADNGKQFVSLIRINNNSRIKGLVTTGNVSNVCSLPEGTTGTVRIDEVPSSLFESSEKEISLDLGEEKSLVKSFNIPKELEHIPFRDLFEFTSADTSIAQISTDGVVKAINHGRTQVSFKRVASSEKVTLLGLGGLTMNFEQSSTVVVKDDHGNTQNDPTTLELGKETRFTINYAWDVDYFHFEKAGYYALTVQLDEALPDNKVVRFSFNNPGDNSWNYHFDKSLDMSADNGKQFVSLIRIKNNSRIKGLVTTGSVSNVCSLPAGTTGTIRIDEVPSTLFDFPENNVTLAIGEEKNIAHSFNIPKELDHIPFEKLFGFTSNAPTIATVDAQGTIQGVQAGRASIALKQLPTPNDVIVLGSGGLTMNFEKSVALTVTQ